jgi:hypothetical protein
VNNRVNKHVTPRRTEKNTNDVGTQVESWPEGLEPHRIEQSVSVYLIWRRGQWVIDWSTIDGMNLDGVIEGGARRESCGCDDDAGCAAAVAAANDAPLPSGQELAALLVTAMVEHADHMQSTGEFAAPTPGVPDPLWRDPKSDRELPGHP